MTTHARLFTFLFVLVLIFLVSKSQAMTKIETLNTIRSQSTKLLENGKIEQAIKAAKEAIYLAERDLGTDHPGFSVTLGNLGEVYSEIGRYVEAEPYLLRALETAEKSWGIGPVVLGAMLHNLGKFYMQQGRYLEAESYYKRALSLELEIGKPHGAVTIWLNSLATLYRLQGRNSEAWPLYERSLSLLSERDSKDPAVAETFYSMGELKLMEEAYDDAEKLFEWSLTFRKDMYGDEHVSIATSLQALGRLFSLRGEMVKAEDYLLQAARIKKKLLPVDHPKLGKVYLALAVHYYRAGLPQKAQGYFKKTFINLTAQLEQYFKCMSESDRLAFLKTVDRAFPIYYSFCAKYAEKYPELSGYMYDLALQQKSLVATSIQSLRARLLATGGMQSLNMLNRLQELRTLISNLRMANPDEKNERKDQIVILEKEANEVERRLARKSRIFNKEEVTDKITWQSVRDNLKPNEAAIEYVTFNLHDGRTSNGKSFYSALIVRSADKYPKMIVLGDSTTLLASPINDYRRRAGLEKNTELVTKPDFYQAFWQPFSQWLSGVERVYVSPDGILNQIAWAVIGSENEILLVDKIDLRVLTSTRDLISNSKTRSSRNAMLVGAPAFGGTEVDTLRFAPLPGTREEIKSIGALLRSAGWNVNMYLGEQANEEHVQFAREVKVLHIATHGFFLSPISITGGISSVGNTNDLMLRSGLALANANNASNKIINQKMSDGLFTALEVSTMDLRGTELVILSACETAIGEQVSGEGVFGLRRAFQQAGAKATLMSLWKVPDKATRELMEMFYREWLGGLDKHTALYKAQMDFRKILQKRWGRDQPKRWGGFVLVGL